MKNKKNSNIKFILAVILIMIVSFFAGNYSSRKDLGLKVYGLIEVFDGILVKNAYVISVVAILVLGLGSWVLFFLGKKKVKSQLARDEEIIDDTLISISAAIKSSTAIISLFLYFNFVRAIYIYDLSIEKFLLVTGLYLANTFCSALLEKKIIDFLKSYNPNIYDRVLDLKFNAKYVDSVDEREKLEIYKAGYKAYRLMSNLLIFFLLAGVIISFEIKGTGAYPLALTIVLIAGIISYTLEALKR